MVFTDEIDSVQTSYTTVYTDQRDRYGFIYGEIIVDYYKNRFITTATALMFIVGMWLRGDNREVS